METETIEREYCAWEPVAVSADDSDSRFFLRGDLRGDLKYHAGKKVFFGFFEFPAKGCETGAFELLCLRNGRETMVRRVRVKYTFDDRYFSPRWENVNAINHFIAEYYAPLAALDVVYRYEKFGREIQLLVLTDPAAAERDKQVALITGRVHNPESGMTSACYRFVGWLLHGEGKTYLKDYVFLIVPLTIPLTFDEDVRSHNVNRLWQPEITAPDLVALRDRVIDRYLPEVWIDCHSFNAVLPLHDPAEERGQCGDYIVAHPVGEKFFDHPYSTAIALRMIAAAEEKGHKHRDEAFFKSWAEHMPKVVLSRPGEKFVTDHHPAGIFSGGDYARYADRGKFGIDGRDWPAMACDYGYYRCHAVNMCLECKPLHVSSESGTVHYPASFPDSNTVKLQELCRVGQDRFQGQPFDGFPCNVIAADMAASTESSMLCAWGRDRREIRMSRSILWRNRYSICFGQGLKPAEIALECMSDIECSAALRVLSKGGCNVQVDGKTVETVVKEPFVFVPFVVRQGRIVFSFRNNMHGACSSK